jgi:hypothetical protein
MTTTLKYFMFGKYNGFVSKGQAMVSACMYFLALKYKMLRKQDIEDMAYTCIFTRF